MADRKKGALRSRFEELDLAVPLDDEEADEILKAAGIDADTSLRLLLEKVDDVEGGLRQERYERAAAKRQQWLGRLQPRETPRPRAELLSIIESLKSQGIEVAANYKNLNEVTDEDLESLVAELELMADDDEET